MKKFRFTKVGKWAHNPDNFPRRLNLVELTHTGGPLAPSDFLLRWMGFGIAVAWVVA